jgi:hypothetical protein
MGNCIGQTWYADRAHRGECVLIALRAGDGRITANLDIRRRGSGWQIHELLARFNDTLDPTLEDHVKRWVKTLAPSPEPPTPALPTPPPVRPRGGASRHSGLPTDLIRALTAEVERALATTQATSARRTYAVLARELGPHADFEPAAAVIALKRLGPAQHAELLHTALEAGLSAPSLWRATSVRPLATAINRLDPDLRSYDRLTTLTSDAPLPRTLRALVRRPEIAPAHAMDTLARATRKAIGTLITADALSRSVARRPTPELICALTIATTCATADATVRLTAAGATAVPGFPTTDLLDEHGPWQQALAAAADLGAPVELFNQRIAEHGLRVPAALLGRGGWPALWHRAHR